MKDRKLSTKQDLEQYLSKGGFNGGVGNRRDTPYPQRLDNRLSKEAPKNSKRRLKVEVDINNIFQNRRDNKPRPIVELKNESMESHSSNRSYKSNKEYKRSSILSNIRRTKKPFSLSMIEPSLIKYKQKNTN